MIVFDMIFPSHDNAPVVGQPGKEPLDFPPPDVASERAPVLGLPVCPPVLAMRGDQFNPMAFDQLRIEAITVIGFVGNQFVRHFLNKAFGDRFLDQFHFSWRSTFRAYGERKTIAVRNCHEFRALAPLGFPDAAPPFFAGTKLPSMKHSFRSSPPRSFRSWAIASSTSSSAPVRTQA